MDANMQSTENNPFYMAGTEGTGEYEVLAVSSAGRVGYRELGDRVRIRLEPASKRQAAKIGKVLTRPYGWTQPGDGGQERFSLGLPKSDLALDSLETALGQITHRRLFGVVKLRRRVAYNPDMPNYPEDLTGE